MSHSNTQEGQNVLKSLGYMRTHWALFFIEALLVVGLTLRAYLVTPPLYQSNLIMLIDSARSQAYQSVMNSPSPLAAVSSLSHKLNMVQLLTSEEAVERFRVEIAEYSKNENHPLYLRNFFLGDSPLPASMLRELVSVNYDPRSDVYSISCSGSSAVAATSLCVIYVKTIQDYYRQFAQRQSVLKREFLAKEIESLTLDIQKEEAALYAYEQSHETFINFLMLNIEGKSLVKLRSDLLELRQKMEANRAAKHTLLTMPQAKRGEHLSFESAIKATTALLSELRYQYFLTKTSTFPDREGRLKAIAARIRREAERLAALNDAEQKAFLKSPAPSEEVHKNLIKLEMEYRTQSTELKSLEDQIESITKEEGQFQSQRLDYERMQAAVANRKKMLSSLFTKQQEVEIELSAGAAEIYKLREPSRSTNPIAPHLSRYLYAALTLSLVVIFATLSGLLLLWPRIDSEGELIKLGLPVIGKLHKIRLNHGRTDLAPSIAIESMKIMSYRILRETKDCPSPLVVITSAGAKDGKSTLSQILAIASHAPDRKTLYIDGDLARLQPNIFFQIHQDRTPGLKALVSQDEPPPLRQIIVPTTEPGLDFLPRGGRMAASLSQKFVRRLERALVNLKTEYHLIVVDTPPLASSNMAHQWLGLADLTILVARVFRSSKRQILEAYDICKLFSKAPVGIAVNGVPATLERRSLSNYYFSSSKGQSETKSAA